MSARTVLEEPPLYKELAAIRARMHQRTDDADATIAHMAEDMGRICEVLMDAFDEPLYAVPVRTEDPKVCGWQVSTRPFGMRLNRRQATTLHAVCCVGDWEAAEKFLKKWFPTQFGTDYAGVPTVSFTLKETP
jgi:hypothetical protein